MNPFTVTRPQDPCSAARFVGGLMQDCFDPVSVGAIDRYTDSPRVRMMYAALVEAFPDATFARLWCVADDSRVAVGGLARGTHLGRWRGVPATGRRVETLATLMFEVSDARVVDLMVVTDSLAIAEQIRITAPVGPKACQLGVVGVVSPTAGS
jgi:predicted ester cyclase